MKKKLIKHRIIYLTVFFLLFVPVITSAQTWNSVETWYYEYGPKDWNSVETWNYDFGVIPPADVTYVSPTLGSSFAVHNFPIKFTVDLDSVTSHKQCMYNNQEVKQKYCDAEIGDEVYWARPWGSTLFPFNLFVSKDDIFCKAKRSFGDFTEGQELEWAYCGSGAKNNPSNELIFWVLRDIWDSDSHPDVDKVNADYLSITGDNVWIGYKREDVGEGYHDFEFTGQDFKSYYSFGGEYPFGDWDTMFMYYDEVFNVSVDSDMRTVTFNEPDVPSDVQDSLGSFDRNVTSRYGILNESLNEGGKMIVAFIVMIVFGSLVGYYGEWNAGVVSITVIMSFFLFIGWLPQIFVVFLLVGVGFIVVKVFMHVFGE